MDDLALEALGVLERGHEGLIGEVAVTVDQEISRESAVRRIHGPALRARIEDHLVHARVEANARQDVELYGHRAQIGLDLRAVLQAALGKERPEAERILDEVGVTARAVPAVGRPHAAEVTLRL